MTSPGRKRSMKPSGNCLTLNSSLNLKQRSKRKARNCEVNMEHCHCSLKSSQLKHRLNRKKQKTICAKKMISQASSMSEALAKQDLFINTSLSALGASLLWNLFREGMTPYRGFFLNLKNFSTNPIAIASPVK